MKDVNELVLVLNAISEVASKLGQLEESGRHFENSIDDVSNEKSCLMFCDELGLSRATSFVVLYRKGFLTRDEMLHKIKELSA